MRIKFKKGMQNFILEKAIAKAGSERKLKKIIGIPNQTINFYRSESRNISKKRLDLILKYLNLSWKDIENLIEEKLCEDWGRYKGGINLIKKHKQNGTYSDYMKYLCIRGKRVFSQWHKKMRKNNPENYYKLQFEKFKRAGLYKYKTNRGEVVRNELERETANYLHYLGLKYEYEPYIIINKNPYFPDFKLGNLIIECTSWRGNLKVNKLKKKMLDFEKSGFNIRFVIPTEIRKFYKVLNKKIMELNNASVAQTIEQLTV